MVMNARDVDRYKRLLLQKRQEVLAASAEGGRGVPVGGPQWEILSTKPMPILKQIFRSGCIRLTVGSCERSRTRWLGSASAHMGCVKPASDLFLRVVLRQCLGRATAATARTASTQPLNGIEGPIPNA